MWLIMNKKIKELSYTILHVIVVGLVMATRYIVMVLPIASFVKLGVARRLTEIRELLKWKDIT
jgi:hypothetical protein